MLFKVRSADFIIPSKPYSQAYLIEDNWNDWWEYKTMYTLYYIDDTGDKIIVGSVKIGQFKMKDQMRPALPDSFDQLDETFFFNWARRNLLYRPQ